MRNSYFIEEIKRNNSIRNKGVGSVKYCKEFYKGIGNIQKKRIYLYGASSKVGKTTVCDYLHILVPYIEGYRNIKYYYFGWEISLADKMAGFCAFFLSHKYNINLDADTVAGLKRDLTADEIDKIADIYDNELHELFGDHDEDGIALDNGIIHYDENRYTASEFEDRLREIAELHGKFVNTKNGAEKYIWHNITSHVHVMIDHLGKTKRSGNTKDAIDKVTDSCVIYRNLCYFTFIIISQFNRGLTAVDRRGLMEANIKPEKTDFKDSSNGAEDCNYLFALFNPLLIAELDQIVVGGKRYTLRKGDKLVVDPGFRSLYLLEARNTSPFEFAFELKNNYIEIL